MSCHQREPGFKLLKLVAACIACSMSAMLQRVRQSILALLPESGRLSDSRTQAPQLESHRRPAPCASALRALSNIDILDAIFSHFEYSSFHAIEDTPDAVAKHISTNHGNDVTRTTTLAHSARVCKTFSEPALRILWRQLPDVFPLLRLLPSLYRVQENVPTGRRQWPIVLDIYHLPKDITEDECDRLLQYATYVRRLFALGPTPFKRAEITEEGWMSIIHALGDQPFLPNLGTLHWLVDRPAEEIPRMTALLSSSVKVMKVYCLMDLEQEVRPPEIQEAWQPYLQQLIETLPERAPKLVDLAFHTEDLDTRLVLEPLSLTHSDSLRTLSLSNAPKCTRISFDLPGLLPLTRFTALQSLTLTLSLADIVVDDRTPEIRLDNLTQLRLPYHPGHSCALDAIASTSLRELEISGLNCFIPFSFQSICASWVRSFPQLESISCWLASEDVEQVASRLPISTLFEPLLTLPRMRKVWIAFTSWLPIVVTDQDFTTFAQAWPLIEQLHLTAAAFHLSCYQTGLPSLVALATHCPRLSDLLMVQLVIRQDDVDNLPSETPNPLHALRAVKVNYGMQPAVYRLVRDRIFPNLVQKPAEDWLYHD
ncbi:hypothetical protein FKP32DRAFT_814087 [Trametes sanguinea]|nr:hypothetical protein FKP32DRAFT_814087 [Trametes sanguinea]